MDMNILDGIMGALGGGQGGLDISKLAGAMGEGGLGGLVGNLTQGGLGDIVKSWVGTGENLPVSLEQLQSALGPDKISQIASGLGIDPSQITQALPGLIDKLTPGGTIPEGGIADILGNLTKGGGIGDILGGLLKR
jgi:uncharacterized protein YidB (DUF937 family)